MSETGDIEVRRAGLGEIFGVRWEVLRPGRPVEAARFAGDESAETIHCGAFERGSGRNVGCATLTRADWGGEPAWQLRGMGVVEGLQGRGVGKAMLGVLEELAREASVIRLLWCNAREEAVGFYEKQGWAVASERFEIEDVGPHYKMVKRI